jgi:DNA-binding NtrC family response regulator
MPKILIADDNLDVLIVMKAMMEGLGYTTAVAEDGQSAFELAATMKPDVVVLDVVMPGASGLQVIPHLKKVSEKSQVIMLSALGDDKTRAAAKTLGAFDYILKPFDAETIVNAVSRAIYSARLEEARLNAPAAPPAPPSKALLNGALAAFLLMGATAAFAATAIRHFVENQTAPAMQRVGFSFEGWQWPARNAPHKNRNPHFSGGSHAERIDR